MKERFLKTDELYILLVDEYIYDLLCDQVFLPNNDIYGINKTFYTIGKSKDGRNFKDIFQLKKYSHQRFSFGSYYELLKIEPLKKYMPNIPELITKKELLLELKKYIELNNIDFNKDKEYKLLKIK